MSRKPLLISMVIGCIACQWILAQDDGHIITVNGTIPANELGITLMHEHILVDFIGADKVSRDHYETDEVFAAALPHLKSLKAEGCQTLVECTPAYIGRDPDLFQQLSEATGLNIITTTGYYGAANDKFVPQHAYEETFNQLATRWIHEAEQGIEGTQIKPGIIKIGVDAGPLSEIDEKLIRAAVLTHKATGLTIASHTGDGVAALEQLDILRELKVDASAFIWVHAQNELDTALHILAANRGAWIEFDGINEASINRHVELVMNMIQHGLSNRTLISQDAGWYHVGESKGGNYRGYDLLFTKFIPELKAAGATKSQIRTLLVENPRKVLEI